MSTELECYTDGLLGALRMRDVPAARIAEALAEVGSHVAETREDPREAFGPPQAYADEVAAALGMPTGAASFWRGALTWRTAAYALSGWVGASLLLGGALPQAVGGGGPLGLPAVVSVLLGLGVLIAMAFALRRLAHRDEDQVLDPRTGIEMTPPLPIWVVAAMVLPPVLAMVLVAVLVLLPR